MRIHLITLLVVIAGIFACEKSRHISDRQESELEVAQQQIEQQQLRLSNAVDQLTLAYCGASATPTTESSDPTERLLVQLGNRLREQSELISLHQQYWAIYRHHLSTPADLAERQLTMRQDHQFIRDEQRNIEAMLTDLQSKVR